VEYSDPNLHSSIYHRTNLASRLVNYVNRREEAAGRQLLFFVISSDLPDVGSTEPREVQSEMTAFLSNSNYLRDLRIERYTDILVLL
jgi:hypothetical protein